MNAIDYQFQKCVCAAHKVEGGIDISPDEKKKKKTFLLVSNLELTSLDTSSLLEPPPFSGS